MTTPQLDFFQAMAQHEGVIHTIVYALSQGDACIQVVGEVGVGKTMTLRYLLRLLQDEYQFCYLPNGYLSLGALCAHVIYELAGEAALPPRYGSDYQLEDVHHALLAAHQAGKRVVLCVDEAQTLSDYGLECLRLMTNLETEEAKLAQLILFGQPELKQKLAQQNLRQMAQRIQYRIDIKPASLLQIHQYVIERLVSAGHPHGALFTEGAVAALYRYSGGIFRVVNVLAHHALISAYVHQRQHVTYEDVRQARRELGYEHRSSVSSWLCRWKEWWG